MESIRLKKTLIRPIAELPELDALVGSSVEIIVLVNDSSAKKDGPRAGAGIGSLVLKPGWDDPIDDFEEYL